MTVMKDGGLKMAMTKEELIEKRKEIAEQLGEIERLEKIEAATPIVGNCYKTRNNYSCPEKPEDYWWLYRKIVAVNEDGFIEAWEFQKTSLGRFEANPTTFYYSRDFGTKISQKQYDEAWQTFVADLQSTQPDNGGRE